MDRSVYDIACYGTSLTTGRLSGHWVPKVEEALRARCTRRLRLYSMGKGSQNSIWGRDNAVTVENMRPRHVLFEGFAINDSANLAVSRADHLLNLNAMLVTFRRISNVVLTLQTMNRVADQSNPGNMRAQLDDYYGDERTWAGQNGIGVLDNTVVWPNPMPYNLTNASDGLHPSEAAVEQYLIPSIVNYLTPIINAAP